MENADITNVYDNLLTKAEKLYNEGFYDECANNVRKLCERHVDDMLDIKGIRAAASDGSQPTLKNKIDALEANFRLPENYILILNYVRVIGNKGSHEQNSVTREEAYKALYYMKEVVKRVSSVMQAARQSTTCQPAADNYIPDKEKRFLTALVVSHLLMYTGVILFLGNFIYCMFTFERANFTPNMTCFGVGFAMAFIGSMLK